MKFSTIALICITVLLTRCGAENEFTPSALSQNQELLIFSAPWCEACETLIPELSRKASALLKNSGLKIKGYLVTGKKISKCATTEEALDYQNHLAVNFLFEADKCPRENYKKYFGESQIQLPTAVLFKDSVLYRKFEPGGFKVDEIIFSLSQ